ncbi:MAG: OmpA family protein [Halioglobus sp.]
MNKRIVSLPVIALGVSLIAACSRTPYTPVVAEVDPIDASAWTPVVDSFVVLLDTSGSMTGEDGAQSKIHGAQDLIASFNSAVPDFDFQSGMIIFGKGAGTCIGAGTANTIYELDAYDREGFADALSSIECAASTTPIADAVTASTDMLADNSAPVAVFIVSDFRWTDPDAVADAVAELSAQQGDNLCLHTVKLGDFTGNDALIQSIADSSTCGSAVSAADIAAGTAMSNYVAESLLAPVAMETYTLSATTLFGFDDATLTPTGKAELGDLAEYITGMGMGVSEVNVTGHTCSIGSAAYNGRLSVRRAQSVAAFLEAQGVSPSLITIRGKGEEQPVADNGTEAGREQNRRVEVSIGTSRPAKTAASP